MSGLTTGGPKFNDSPADNDVHEWMWWRWKYKASTQKWEVTDRLESPSTSTPGLVYHTPELGSEEPALTYEWWWIPHVRDSETQVITTHGKLHVRDRTQSTTFGNPENPSGGEWVEISVRENTDPEARGPRGYTIWAGHGAPAQDLNVGTHSDLPYSGDVDDILGDFYIDLDACDIYGPKYVGSDDQETWGVAVSILGPPVFEYEGDWVSGTAYTATAPTPYDNTIGKHSIVTHTPFDSNIKQTFMCTQDISSYTEVVPACINRWRIVGGTHPPVSTDAVVFTQFGEFGTTGDYNGDNLIYLKTASNAITEDHYWFEIVPHWNGNNASGDWDIGDHYYTNSNASPAGTTYGTTYSYSNVNHHWIQVKAGGPDHAQFRLNSNSNVWGSWTAFDTDYTGEGDDYNDDFTYHAWIDTGVHSGVHVLTGDYASQLDAQCVHSAMYYAMLRMYKDYLDNSNTQQWNFNVIPSLDLTPSSTTQRSSSSLTLSSHRTGTASGYPLFVLSTEDMYDHEPNCDGSSDTSSTSKSTSSADRFGDECGDADRLFTMSFSDEGIADDKEPYKGSPYWDVLLGADNIPRPVNTPRSGVMFRFGGFEKQLEGNLVFADQQQYFKDWKTFNAFTEQQANSSPMGWHVSGDESDRHINKLTPGPLFTEWGMDLVEPWWRTVGRNYDETAKIVSDPPEDNGTTFEWVEHGDYITFDDGGSAGTRKHAPIPPHFICLKPGNKYKITLWCTVTPQWGPVCKEADTTNQAYQHFGPCTWNRTVLDTGVDPTTTTGKGWYEVGLWTIPDQRNNGSINPIGKEVLAWNDNDGIGSYEVMDRPNEDSIWKYPYCTIITGIGSTIGAQWNHSTWNWTSSGGELQQEEDRDTVAEQHCLSNLQFTFVPEDWTGGTDDMMANNPNYDWTFNANSETGEIKFNKDMAPYMEDKLPLWSASDKDWIMPTTSTAESDTDDFREMQCRVNHKFKMDSFVYAPTEEETAPGVPGDCWIGVYYDANWWADMMNWALRWSYGTNGTSVGDYAVGVLPAYPLKPTDSYEHNPAQNDVTNFIDRRGGGLMIELLEEG